MMSLIKEIKEATELAKRMLISHGDEIGTVKRILSNGAKLKVEKVGPKFEVTLTELEEQWN